MPIHKSTRISESEDREFTKKFRITSSSTISEDDFEENPDYIFVEEEEDWSEEEIMKEKPEYKENRNIERNLKLCSEREKEEMLENAEEFINLMEDELERHKTKVIDFKQKCVWRECDNFNDEYGTTTQEVEESYYLYKKREYEK
jgi:hypothetical protein